MVQRVGRSPAPPQPRARTLAEAAPKAGRRLAPRDELSTGRGRALREKLGGGTVGHREGARGVESHERFFDDLRRVGQPDNVGGTIRRDPRFAGVGRPEHDKDAVALLKKNRARELEALSKLPPEQQAAYRKLQKKLQGDPQAQLALQLMLLDGRLTSSQQASNGDTLLTGLSKLAEQPLAPGLDAATLLSQTVRELAVPSSITQGDFTCGATSLQVQLAVENPAEYVRLLSGLASPSGSVELANGDRLEREPHWNADELRSLPSRLLQSAFMEYANGAEWDYDPATDRSVGNSPANRGQSGAGLEGVEMERLERGLFGRDVRLVPEPGADPTSADLDGVLENLPSLVCLEFPKGTVAPVKGHAVVVTDVKDGVVTYVNPQSGLECTMPLEQFEQQFLYGLASE